MRQIPSIEAEAVGLSAARLARIDPWMEGLVESGALAGIGVTVLRRGAVVYRRCCGLADRERGTAMTDDSILRIYSMTKPITSVAIMMLYEEGRFQLDDPISRFLPGFAEMHVLADGSGASPETVPAARGISFRDLLTHTAGLTYHFLEATPLDARYRAEGIDFMTFDGTLGELVERAATLPLLAQPGSAWNYSIATDILGHLVERISGRGFAEFLHERIFGPLGMVDTDFHVPAAKLPRFAANYLSRPKGLALIDDPARSRFANPVSLPSGGGGLCSTSGDYLRFCRMLLNGGELDGVRLLGRKTVALMMSNHLGGDLASMGQARFSESSFEGIGFGLGFSVMLDPARAQILGTPGECAWGGLASTAFWVDPGEAMAVVLMTQLIPSSALPIRRQLRVLTYQALID